MIKHSRTVFSGRVVQLRVEQVTLPNGHEATLEVVQHPGGAAVVAIDAAERVCLLRQYRHVAGAWLDELPAGKLDPGESPETTAHRELAEEGGVTAASLESLGQVISSPGVFTEIVHLFLARELSAVPLAPEHGEVFETRWVPLAEALADALDGRLQDAKTVIGLVRAAHRLEIARRSGAGQRARR